MSKKEEKKQLQKLEVIMRQQTDTLWASLRFKMTQPILYTRIHPSMWGHKTKSWRKPNTTVSPVIPQPPVMGASAETDSNVPPPPKLPPLKTDTYDNVSTILTCQASRDGDWQVEQEGETSSISSFPEEEDITVISAEVHASNCEYERDEVEEIQAQMAMTAHPPPYLTIQEYEAFPGEECEDSTEQVGYEQDCSEQDDTIAYTVYNDDCTENYNGQEDYYAGQEDYYTGREDYYTGQENDYTEQQQECQPEEDPYALEFQAFYAAYEEGADHLYIKDDDEGGQDVYWDPGGT
jgi:hypothetical protein